MDLTYLQSAVSGTDGTSFSFASHNYGTAFADRYIFTTVDFRGDNSVTISSATIGGVSASIVAPCYNTTGGFTSGSAILVAAVPSGTSGTTAISLSGTAYRLGIGTFSVTGLLSTTPTDYGTSTAANPTYAIDVAAGGIVIACSYNANTATYSWSNITERFDEAVEGAGSRHSGAGDIFVAAQTNLSITATISSSLTPSASFASWAPAPTFIPRATFII